jgi:two-component SAPR family response regulator
MNKTPLFQSVMIIDDNKIDILLFARILKSINYAKEIISCEGSRDAISYFKDIKEKRIRKSIPDLIFLDINTPDTNGSEFLDRQADFGKKICNQLKIVMVTSSPDDEVITAKHRNVIKRLPKPLNKEILLNEEFLKLCS